ncbi:MAG TPA: hypothetical protein VGL35_03450 [Rhizomicrobium sp.]|jgi:hypothetical protein
MQPGRPRWPWNTRRAQNCARESLQRYSENCTSLNGADRVFGEIGAVLVIMLASAAAIHFVLTTFQVG